MTEEEAKRHAFFHLNKRWRILAPQSEASVSFPEFDPCKASSPIAVVKWPAIVNCREVILTHFIHDNDRVVQ